MGASKCSEKKHGKCCLFLKGMDIVIHWPEKLGYFGIVTPTNPGWWFHPLWKIWKSVGMMTFPIYGEIKFMFQSTNQICTNPIGYDGMINRHRFLHDVWRWWYLCSHLWSKSWMGDILSQFLTLCYGRSGREKNGWIVELNGSSCCIAMLTYRRGSRLCPPENTHGSQSVQKVGHQIHVVSNFLHSHGHTLW